MGLVGLLNTTARSAAPFVWLDTSSAEDEDKDVTGKERDEVSCAPHP